MTKEQFEARRKELGYSKQELAKRLHVVRSTVYKWENGTHPIPNYIGELMQHIEPFTK